MADIWAEIVAERVRAHAKHGDTSMESTPATSLDRLAILTEEVGEVARVFNDARHRVVDVLELRSELVQVAAMAVAWIDAVDGAGLDAGRLTRDQASAVVDAWPECRDYVCPEHHRRCTRLGTAHQVHACYWCGR